MKTCDPNPIAFSEILWLVTSFRIREVDVVFKRQVVKGLCASVLYVGGASLCMLYAELLQHMTGVPGDRSQQVQLA